MGQKKDMVQKTSILSPFKQNHSRQVPSCMDLSGFGGAQKEMNRTHFPKNPSHLVPNRSSPPNLRQARQLRQLRQLRQQTDRRCRLIGPHAIIADYRPYTYTRTPPTFSYTHQPPKPCTPPPQYATNIARKSVTPRKPRGKPQ
jgi:hypothetical protein